MAALINIPPASEAIIVASRHGRDDVAFPHGDVSTVVLHAPRFRDGHLCSRQPKGFNDIVFELTPSRQRA